MKRTFAPISFALLCLALFGCNDAKKFAADTREGYKIVEAAVAETSQMVASLDTNDLARAKEAAAKIERVLSTRVLSWYFRILAVEETEGNDAAKTLIAELKKTENINATETKALAEMEQYFQRKDGRTGDILFIICAIAAESKYGHGAGGLFLRLANKYRKFETYPAEPGTNLTTNAAAPDSVGLERGK